MRKFNITVNGKTYEVDKCVKEDEEKRIYISLFGIESPSSIYKSLLWQFCSRDEKKDKIFKRLGNAFHVMDEKLSSASEKYGIASGILKVLHLVYLTRKYMLSINCLK